MSAVLMSTVLTPRTVSYPERDGQPMGETDTHRLAMVRFIELLTRHYAGQQVYVSGDLLVYYVEGNPKKVVVPDAFIAKGVAPGKRRIYKIWEEGKVPDLVIETTSRKTRLNDLHDKSDLYASLGVQEYFLFDPEGDYLDPPLQGRRLNGATYESIPPNAEGRLPSRELEMTLCIENGDVQFYRDDTGERLLDGFEYGEQQRIAFDAEAVARRRAEDARLAAERELAELRAELARKGIQ